MKCIELGMYRPFLIIRTIFRVGGRLTKNHNRARTRACFHRAAQAQKAQTNYAYQGKVTNQILMSHVTICDWYPAHAC